MARVSNDPQTAPAAARAGHLDHQDDEHRRRVTHGRRRYRRHGTCAVRGEVRPPEPPVRNRGCLPGPVKSAYGVPSGSAAPPLDRTRPTGQSPLSRIRKRPPAAFERSTPASSAICLANPLARKHRILTADCGVRIAMTLLTKAGRTSMLTMSGKGISMSRAPAWMPRLTELGWKDTDPEVSVARPPTHRPR